MVLIFGWETWVITKLRTTLTMIKRKMGTQIKL
jgi:hypothetical protein